MVVTNYLLTGMILQVIHPQKVFGKKLTCLAEYSRCDLPIKIQTRSSLHFIVIPKYLGRKCHPPYIGVSKNRGAPPKWMVKIMGKPYCLMDDLGGKPTIFGNIYIPSTTLWGPLFQWLTSLLLASAECATR